MTIRDRELHELRAAAITHELAQTFDLGWLKITVAFDQRNEDTDRILCETKADWEYRQATFVWNVHQVASTPDPELEETAVHELVHALIAPLWGSLSERQQDKLHQVHELSTENVARVLSHLLERNQ